MKKESRDHQDHTQTHTQKKRNYDCQNLNLCPSSLDFFEDKTRTKNQEEEEEEKGWAVCVGNRKEWYSGQDSIQINEMTLDLVKGSYHFSIGRHAPFPSIYSYRLLHDHYSNLCHLCCCTFSTTKICYIIGIKRAWSDG